MLLSTRSTGSGPRTIALVHGLGADGALWRSLVERIVALGDTTVITVDLRGHGDSAPGAPYTLATFADDLAETLPAGLDALVGHSLGGAVAGAAAARVRPRHAIYLDPGFALALPAHGVKGRLFWAGAPLTLAVAAMSQQRKAKGRPAPSPEDAALQEQARAAFDRGMTVAVFRDLAHHPLRIGPPPVPSTIVLSDDSPAVVPDAVADALAAQGWEVRRVAGVGHDFWLEDADLTWKAIRDLLGP